MYIYKKDTKKNKAEEKILKYPTADSNQQPLAFQGAALDNSATRHECAGEITSSYLYIPCTASGKQISEERERIFYHATLLIFFQFENCP